MKKNGDFLTGLVLGALNEGEVPYKANRRAVEALDIQENADTGVKELRTVLSGIDAFDASLKEIEDAARSVARNAAAVL